MLAFNDKTTWTCRRETNWNEWHLHISVFQNQNSNLRGSWDAIESLLRHNNLQFQH
jgi:hypothetical protein